MNANELAEQIEKHAQLLDNLTDFPKGVCDIKEAATILRQLQAENEALKEQNKALKEQNKALKEQNKALDERNYWIEEHHPVKELTDEEIADFLYAYCLDMGDVYEASEAKLIECVRAILRKAQEK